MLPTKKKTAKKTDNISHNWVAEKKEHIPLPATNYASASRRQSTSDHLYMYTNPAYTDQELEWFEDVWASSIAGATIDKLIEYVFGNGIKPTFELIDDGDLDEEQKKAQLKSYENELKISNTIR